MRVHQGPREDGRELVRPLVDLHVDHVLRDRVALEPLGQLAQPLDVGHGLLEVLQRDVDVQLVDLPLDPAEVVLLAVHVDAHLGLVPRVVHAVEQIVPPDRDVSGQVAEGFGRLACRLSLRAESSAQILHGLAECGQEFALGGAVALIMSIGKRLGSKSDVDGVGHSTVFCILAGLSGSEVGTQVNHVDVLQLPALLCHELRGSRASLRLALVDPFPLLCRHQEMVVQQHDVHRPPGFPRGRVQLDPMARLHHDMPSRHRREELLRPFDRLPQRLELDVPHAFEVGDRAAVGSLGCAIFAHDGHGVDPVGQTGLSESVGELRHQGAKGPHLALELLRLSTNLDELRAVLVDILLQIGGGAVLDLAEAFLVVLDLLLGGIGQ